MRHPTTRLSPDSLVEADPDEADRLEYFRILQNGFHDAVARAGGLEDREYRIADETLRLRFAGPALPPRLCRALDHLSAPAGPAPDLTVLLWDSASTGRKLPLLAASLLRLLKLTWLEDRGVRGEILGYNGQRIRAVYDGGSEILCALDTVTRTAVYWTADAERLPYHESGAPLRTILHWWLDRPDRQVVHAGAVGTETAGVLLAGKGGTGKSTTALACVDAGLRYVSDDYTVVTDAPDPVAHSLYNTAKVKTESEVKRFPWLADWVSNREGAATGQEKPMVFLHEHRPESLVSRLPLRGIVFPRVIGPGPARLVPVSPDSAFKAMAPSTVTQLPGAGPRSLHFMRSLARRLPCFLLDLGSDLGAVPAAIRSLLTDDHA